MKNQLANMSWSREPTLKLFLTFFLTSSHSASVFTNLFGTNLICSIICRLFPQCLPPIDLFLSFQLFRFFLLRAPFCLVAKFSAISSAFHAWNNSILQHEINFCKIFMEHITRLAYVMTTDKFHLLTQIRF